MSKKFKLEQPLPLETVYIAAEAKAWIKEQSVSNGVSMVAVLDEMVRVCKEQVPAKRPNALRSEEGDNDA